MRRIWWVRHGPTHRREMVGWSDVPADLTDTAALARLEAFLPDVPVVSSDLSRAIATADALQGTRRRLRHTPNLREIHFGDWEMKTADQIAASHPELAQVYWDDPIAHAPPGGETLSELMARVAAALDDLAAYPDLIVVAHFGVILSQLHLAWGGSVKDTLAQPIDNLSVTQITISDRGYEAGVVNRRP